MLLTQPQIAEREPTALKVTGIDCPVALRRSKRATRFSLKVSHTERAAILTLPERGRLEEAGDFLARHFDWLKRQVDRLPKPIPFAHGAVISLRGRPHVVAFVGPVRNRGVVWIEEAGNAGTLRRNGRNGLDAKRWPPQLHLQQQPCKARYAASDRGVIYFKLPEWCGDEVDSRSMPRICVAGGVGHAPRRLADWLRAEARADLAQRVWHHATNLGCQPKRVSVRDQATRWGSCSTTGTLSFSWRLIFAPSFVLDYVAAHEVAHLREMNHGPRFWRLVKQTLPDMHKARAWLKAYGAGLHSFGAGS